jgi:mono/diheme cytochrome c family protein
MFVRAAITALLPLLWACGAPVAEGTSSGAECENGSTLDYESFGAKFMTDYCTQCHSSKLAPSERNGAPSDHDFDSLEAIHETPEEHIDHVAAAGSHVSNASMPPAGYPEPSRQEREELGRWLACGAP